MVNPTDGPREVFDARREPPERGFTVTDPRGRYFCRVTVSTDERGTRATGVRENDDDAALRTPAGLVD